MNTKLSLDRFLSAIGFTLLIAVLAACGSPAAASLVDTPTATAVSEANTSSTGDLRLVPVEDVQVQIGVGSPIPVDVVVSGTWPDLCAQLAQTTQRFASGQIEIALLATAADPNCPPDHLGLPFRIALPINVVELPAGTYAVAVNGVTAELSLASPADGSTASINGWVWHDRCDSGKDGQPAPTSTPPGCVAQPSPLGDYRADGVLDADETPIASVIVKLRAGACLATSLTEVQAEMMTLASDLSYSFSGLTAGTYCVSIDPQQEPNFTLLRPGLWTYPAVTEGLIGTTVTLQPGENKFDVNFGWDYQFK